MDEYRKMILNLVKFTKKEEEFNSKRTNSSYVVNPENIAERMIVIKNRIDEDIKDCFLTDDADMNLCHMEDLSMYESEDDLFDNDTNYSAYSMYEYHLLNIKDEIDEYFKLKHNLNIVLEMMSKCKEQNNTR